MNRAARHAVAIEGVRSPSRAGLLIAFAAAVTLAACGGGEPAQPAPTPAAPPAQPAATTAAPAPADAAPAAERLPVDELLKRARQALTDERLVSPAGDNAVEYYLQVLEQDGSNAQATQALVDVFPLAAGIAERALAQRQADEAARVIGLLDRVDPRSYTVATLRTKLASTQAQVDREQQQATAAAAQQQAAAAAARQAAAAQTPAAAPTEAPAPPPPVVQAPPPPSPAPTPTPAPAPAPAAVETPAAPVAAPPVAAAPASAAGGETRDARPLRQVPPQFPVDAARKRQEGWVELEFTIAADGSVRDVSVARAQPTRVFDREAVRAMQQWTFEPALRNGQPVDSRGRRRINFEL